MFADDLLAVAELAFRGVVDEGEAPVGVERVHGVVDSLDNAFVPLQVLDSATTPEFVSEPLREEFDELPFPLAERPLACGRSGELDDAIVVISDDDGHTHSRSTHVRIGGLTLALGDGERAPLRCTPGDVLVNNSFFKWHGPSLLVHVSLAGGVLDNVRVVVDTCDRTGARSEVLTAQREQSLHSVFDAVVVHGRSL